MNFKSAMTGGGPPGVAKILDPDRLVINFFKIPMHSYSSFYSTMPPNTRATHRENTPPKHKTNTEWSSLQKQRFFDACRTYNSKRKAAKAEYIPWSIAKNWIK